MVSPVHGDYRRCQAEIPLIVLFRFPGPALTRGRGRATGVIVLLDGKILGGDTHFYYTGSYTFKNGKWRGELGRVLINASEPDVRFQGTIR